MKYFIVLAIAVVLIHVADCVDFSDDIFYDDPIEDRAISEDEEEYEKPKYHLKDAPTLFVKFIHEYKKKYKDEKDYNKRYEAFVKNLKDIIENNKSGGGSVSEINSFADYDEDELSKLIG